MLDTFIYEDHLGRRFNGLENGVYLNYSELRDYTWSYETINNRISRFYRSAMDRRVPLVVSCKTLNEAITVKHRLLELTETDIEAMLPGKLYIGDCYTTGYITASAKSNFLLDKRICNIDLTLTSDDTSWYRERAYAFPKNATGTIGIGSGTDYPYDYMYDYAISAVGRSLTAGQFSSSTFKILIYGAATNPVVTIGSHQYAINGTIGTGETLLIDSLTKTITLTTATGSTINWFDKRNRDSYIFEPIPAGQNSIAWDASFGFDLTVIEKRSEPIWT